MAQANKQQFPHVRALTICLACGGPKDAGLLVCWPCHNELKLIHDHGYGPDVDLLIETADAKAEALMSGR